MNFDLQLDLSHARMTLEQLEANAKDMSPAMKAIALKLKASVQRNFEEGGRYESAGEIMGGANKWEPAKAPPTYKRGNKSKGIAKGDEKGTTLLRSGHLRRSISASGDRDEALVRTNTEYAAIHNFGGQTGRGRKVKMPARPFMVIQDSDVENAKDLLVRHLLPP